MKLKKEFIIRTIAGQDVIVATGAEAMRYNGLLTLTPTAKFILQNLEKVTEVDQLIDMMLQEYDVDRQTATEDACGFIATMIEHGFIEY